jgi:hypothetical protein
VADPRSTASSCGLFRMWVKLQGGLILRPIPSMRISQETACGRDGRKRPDTHRPGQHCEGQNPMSAAGNVTSRQGRETSRSSG